MSGDGRVVRQSPIDIQSVKAEYDPSLASRPFHLKYPEDVRGEPTLENTGHTWKVSIPDDRFILEGGPLDDVYQLDQFHAHWGPTNVIGSEHMVDQKSYAAEVHFVHWNKSKCKSIGEALALPDGLAVLGVFLTVGKHNPEMDKLTSLMNKIKYKGQKVSLADVKLVIRKLLPEDLSQYWTYDGSLTTTPYDDCVIWTVFKHVIEMSPEQLEAMRQLCCHSEGEANKHHEHGGQMLENYRPVQEQTNSKLRVSFK